MQVQAKGRTLNSHTLSSTFAGWLKYDVSNVERQEPIAIELRGFDVTVGWHSATSGCE